MSSAQNVQQSAAARYPKRKRAQVEYAEPEVDGEEYVDEDDSQDVVEFPQTKKHKSSFSRPLPKRKIFPFMELPAEIRNEIYRLCLTASVGIFLRSTTKKFRRTVCQVSEEDLIGNHSCDFFDHSRYSADNGSADDSIDADSSIADDETTEAAKAKEETKKPRPSEETTSLVPALLAVNKQMHYECRDLLYNNHFYLENPLALHSFLVDIGPRAASLLKDITLMQWSDGRGHKSYNHTCFTALMGATNLESFNTHGYLRSGASGKHVAIQMYRDSFPWLEAVGHERRKPDAAVDIFNIRCTGGYYGDFKEVDEFRAHLRKLLNSRMDRIRS
ncbi:hypothetical protein K458DRAFT_343244 [Lentithecium fluviatile CBS 122367]|uniref:DUF7730 domain-containing protein n=1 Tax=Lentithecium fluviatile CBS 122367 TaxID=1168545 RepID=A0A6G1ITV0_9PLEO|nr:hypothetical protein K458DRAFT_343244 [Lentithecium fluviatile CBS 122367]